MIDLCFGNAMKGCLLYAQGVRSRAAVHVETLIFQEGEDAPFEETRQKALEAFRRQEEERRRLWGDLYGPLDGSREDVLYLNQDFSLGEIRDISAPDLMEKAAAGEVIRVWDSNTPYTRCGLMAVCELLEGLPCEIRVVSLPESYTRKDGVVIQWRGWEEMEPELLGHFSQTAKPLTTEERADFARQWRQLRQENAALRVMENGRVLSAPIDYYDDRIRKEFPTKPAKAAETIVRAMTRQNVSHGDEFIGQRLRALIEAGELRLIEEDPERFARSVIAPR